MANKYPEVTTPIGTAIYPRVNKPDTKFDKAGVFSLKLRLEGEDATSFAAHVREFARKAYEEECNKRGRKQIKKAGLPFKDSVDKSKDGEETAVPGCIDFSMKRKASGETREGKRWEAKVALFDAATPPKPTNAEVWGGSKVRARVALVPWFTDSLGFGVRLELRAVQVIELVTGGARDAAGYGFDGVDGGYDAPTETPSESKPAGEEGSGGSEKSDKDEF